MRVVPIEKPTLGGSEGGIFTAAEDIGTNNVCLLDSESTYGC
jgi:hypothetical protein